MRAKEQVDVWRGPDRSPMRCVGRDAQTACGTKPIPDKWLFFVGVAQAVRQRVAVLVFVHFCARIAENWRFGAGEKTNSGRLEARDRLTDFRRPGFPVGAGCARPSQNEANYAVGLAPRWIFRLCTIG